MTVQRAAAPASTPPPGANPGDHRLDRRLWRPTGAVSIPGEQHAGRQLQCERGRYPESGRCRCRSLFQIDANGQLSSSRPPDFEAPTDQGDGTGNNTLCGPGIRATDAWTTMWAVQTPTVTVTNVVEATAPTQTVTIERMALDTGTGQRFRHGERERRPQRGGQPRWQPWAGTRSSSCPSTVAVPGFRRRSQAPAGKRHRPGSACRQLDHPGLAGNPAAGLRAAP